MGLNYKLRKSKIKRRKSITSATRSREDHEWGKGELRAPVNNVSGERRECDGEVVGRGVVRVLLAQRRREARTRCMSERENVRAGWRISGELRKWPVNDGEQQQRSPVVRRARVVGGAARAVVSREEEEEREIVRRKRDRT